MSIKTLVFEKMKNTEYELVTRIPVDKTHRVLLESHPNYSNNSTLDFPLDGYGLVPALSFTVALRIEGTDS